MRVEPFQALGAFILGAVLAVAVPAWFWLRCPGLKQACD